MEIAEAMSLWTVGHRLTSIRSLKQDSKL